MDRRTFNNIWNVQLTKFVNVALETWNAASVIFYFHSPPFRNIITHTVAVCSGWISNVWWKLLQTQNVPECVEATCISMLTCCWQTCSGLCNFTSIPFQHTSELTVYQLTFTTKYDDRKKRIGRKSIWIWFPFYWQTSRDVIKLSFPSCWHLSVHCGTILSHLVTYPVRRSEVSGSL